MTEFLVKFFGVLAGVVARSLLPWLRKLREHEVQGFDRRYLISAIASFIICFIISLLIFPQFNPPLSPASRPASPTLNSSASEETAKAQIGNAGSATYAQTPKASNNLSFEAYFKLFCLAFGFGFGFDGLIKEAGQWVRFYGRRNQYNNQNKL